MDTRKVQVLQTGNEKALCLMNEDMTGDVAAFYKEQSDRHVQTIIDRANAYPELVEALNGIMVLAEQRAEDFDNGDDDLKADSIEAQRLVDVARALLATLKA